MYNHVTLVGNVTRDPELRYTNSGTPVLDLGLACNRKYKDTEETLFVDVDVWGKQAEICNEHLKKGKQILVAGRLKLDTWGEGEDKRSKIKVVAEEVKFLGKKDD